MLQQTQASRVAPVFTEFMRRYPRVDKLARASRADVVRAWKGLGYNRRAVALSDAARMIVLDFGGRVPRAPEDLRRLPGVGPYTAAAVAAIAFGARVPAVDVNVGRVAGRALLGGEGHDVPNHEIHAAVGQLMDGAAPADVTQALMDLGRFACRSSPRCEECPLAFGCRFVAFGSVPTRAPRRQDRFEGSDRQVRGAVVRTLRDCRSASVRRLVTETGFDVHRVGGALRSLTDDGIVRAGRAALRGEPAGRARLAS